jgi:hypothetical protein
MCSSTPSFDSSFVLNESGSSRTAPSRFPRMFVENQPSIPSIRALKPGARIVFMSVCPVLKSFPAIGTPRSSAVPRGPGSRRQVRSSVGVGDPLHDRRVGVDHARRDRGIVRLHRGLERLERLRADAPARRKISVEPHQIMTIRSHPFSERNGGCPRGAAGPARTCSPGLHVRTVEAAHVFLVEHGGHRRIDRRKSSIGSRWRRLQHPRFIALS